ncbi:hypothetical protein B0T21DRAFT_354477 [Apiosordaria backusii]|uniref:Uncharacterized protein n=1 Tax=Apiosordaria backusii TaxID=314023 RepID=A0AA40K6T4_9PEZI|nr:hypothetical protein B0T21DRAFT_354477 [Apiosordaria backusii]
MDHAGKGGSSIPSYVRRLRWNFVSSLVVRLQIMIASPRKYIGRMKQFPRQSW